MGHAIRDAAHAIMPRMLLVCAGSSVNVTRKSRVECRNPERDDTCRHHNESGWQ